MSRSVQPRVLIVDDEPAIRRVLSRYLRHRGCHVETAADGLQGLDRLAQASYDVIVSDVHMPQMDGLTFLRHALARDPSLRHRVLLCSGLWSGPGADDPAVHFLPKPFGGDELWEAMTRLLARRPEAPSADGS